jgi:hypothetical protein
MIRHRLRVLLLVATTLACSLVPTPTAVVAVTAPSPTAETAPTETTEQASADDRRMSHELRDLASAWADGGGTFGYPFWDKAGQRWRTGEITTTMYREYVTGYRDRLVLGCDLLDAIDTSTEVADEVRGRVLDSCHERVDALRAQQRWLDARIAADTAPDDDVAAAEERATTAEAEAEAHLEDSYRDARLALDQAQAALDAVGLKRLHEDAFI